MPLASPTRSAPACSHDRTRLQTTITYSYGLHGCLSQGNQLNGTLPAAWGTLPAPTPPSTPPPSSWPPPSTPPPSSPSDPSAEHGNGTLASTLRLLYLYKNQLQGSIPAAWANIAAMDCMDVRLNPGLCGLRPSNLPYQPPCSAASVVGTLLGELVFKMPAPVWCTGRCRPASGGDRQGLYRGLV